MSRNGKAVVQADGPVVAAGRLRELEHLLRRQAVEWRFYVKR